MSINEDLAKYAGSWRGTNKLHVTWMPDPLKESESGLEISLKANGQFVAFEYTWTYDGAPQEGLILLGCDTQSDAVQTVWTDSWHSSHTFMLSDGTVDENGSVSVKGHYKVKDNPDWGWGTDVIPAGDSIRIVMYNVSPDGEEEIAVETDFTRI
ncbi:MAG: DUF1579 family protein [Pyrinomonadaceae bacterium]